MESFSFKFTYWNDRAFFKPRWSEGAVYNGFEYSFRWLWFTFRIEGKFFDQEPNITE